MLSDYHSGVRTNVTLRYDRRWMVVDESGTFLSQGSHPRMALVVPSIGDGAIGVNAPGMPALEIPLHPSDTVSTNVAVWNDVCPATWVGERAAQWFRTWCTKTPVEFGSAMRS